MPDTSLPEETKGVQLSFKAPLPQETSELVKYVLVELDVLRENHEKFQDEMRKLVEVMFDHKRWELVFAAYPITGVLNRFVHIWKIPDESSIVEIMREGALKNQPQAEPNETSLAREFRDVYRDVQELIQSTTHTLLTSLPYDPTHVGYQSQTIIIDAEEETFIIDHRKLRDHGKGDDISEKLDQLPRLAPRLRAPRKPDPDSRAKLKERFSSEQSPTRELREIQNHLNRGTSIATVDYENGKALLFNLAGLKPRSVFQQFEQQPAPKNVHIPKSVKGNGNVDLPVTSLLLATPWGGVYALNEKKLTALASQIPAAQKAATTDAVAPLIRDRVPLAAIPEERDEIIGDGCACYVINLASYHRK